MPIRILYPDILLRVSRFPGGEIHIQLDRLPAQPPNHIRLYAVIQNSDDLMTLLLVHNALLQHYPGKLQIELDMPYFPYARQDRVCARGQAFSLQVMAQLIRNMQLHALRTWDAHSALCTALTGAVNIPPHRIIAQSPRLVAHLQQPNALLVCPDQGAREKCQAIQQAFSVKALLYANKQRDTRSGAIRAIQLPERNLQGKLAIICDDICDGGSTFIELAKKLREQGVEKIVLYVTHGIFSKGLEVLAHWIDEIHTSDSLPQTETGLFIVPATQTLLERSAT